MRIFDMKRCSVIKQHELTTKNKNAQMLCIFNFVKSRLSTDTKNSRKKQ